MTGMDLKKFLEHYTPEQLNAMTVYVDVEYTDVSQKAQDVFIDPEGDLIVHG